MLAVVASQLEQNPTLEAFQEETSFVTLDSNRNVASLIDVLKGHSHLKLVAADHGAVATVEELNGVLGLPHNNSEKLYDRAQQYQTIGVQHRLIETRADLDQAFAAHGDVLVLRPRRIGAMDTRLVFRNTDRAAARSLIENGEYVACTCSSSPQIVVDTVSLNGRHVTSDVALLRVDERGSALHVRHRLSLLDTDPQVIAAEQVARDGLDALGSGDGASQVELVRTNDEWRISEIRSAPETNGAGADASFAAFGYSHAHLYCESVLRPSEFERRFNRPPRRKGLHLASAPIHCWTEPHRDGTNGLRLLRRLTGYHSVRRISQMTEAGVEYVVSFVHDDRASIENSLKVLHEMEDSGSFFGTNSDFIAYAPARPGQSW